MAVAARATNDYGQMTMAKSRQTVAAAEFKAKCLALLDRVSETRESFVITKRGRPVAKLVPIDDSRTGSDLEGSISFEGDLISPIEADWEANG